MKFSYIFSKPLDLVSFQEQIKADGINCPLNKLVDFLDQQVRNRPFAGKGQKWKEQEKISKSAIFEVCIIGI